MITDIIAAGILTGCSILILYWMLDDMLTTLCKPVKYFITRQRENGQKRQRRKTVRHQ